jgi:hypothetical protein
VLSLAAQSQTTMTERAPGEVPQDVAVEPIARADPDVVVRGRSTRIVIQGRDAEALKTLQVHPPEGIRVESITPLPSRSDGLAAVSVAIAVDAAAATGERALMLSMPMKIVTDTSTRGDDEAAKQLQAFIDAVAKEDARPEEFGRLYVNSHDISITAVEVERPPGGRVRITATDPAGDIEFSSPAPIEIGGSPADIELADEPIISEARCGSDVFVNVLVDAAVASRSGSAIVTTAELVLPPLGGPPDCELRVRLQDKAGNTSAWFKTAVARR